MRTRILMLTGSLLAPAAAAFGQPASPVLPADPAPVSAQAGPVSAAAPPASDTATSASVRPTFGTIEFGFRGSSLGDGDVARYNRFRDWRNGGGLGRFRFESVSTTSLWHAEADNVGYRDQRYALEFRSIGRLKARGEWNQIPLFISRDTRTLFTVSPSGRFTVDDAIRQGIQAGTTTLAAVIGQARPIEIRSRRDIATLDMTYTASRDVDLKLNIRSAHRSGYNLQSLNFGFSNTIESGVPLDDRSTSVKAALEFANARGVASIGYDGSWYDNQIHAYRYDNPLRFTDIVGGPSLGQMSTWPSSMMQSVNINGGYHLPGRTRASAVISVGRLSQNNTLLPPTVNTALVAPVLERSTAEAEARTVSMVYTLNARPRDFVWLNARYRYYDYDTRTPAFGISSMVVADNTLGAAKESEPLDIRRQTVDLEASFTPIAYAALNLGYTREQGDRTFRIFGRTTENLVRASIDSTGNPYVTLRGVVEKSVRTGSHDDFELLAEIGEQTGMRHFDIADRDRVRTSLILQVTPVPMLGLNGSVATGRDEYRESYFGLRDNHTRAVSAGFDLAPRDTITLGANWGRERYTALQRSRTALPLPNPQFNDPTRNWSIDSGDHVTTVSANLDLIKTFRRTDIRVAYDLSDGRSTYVYGLTPDSTIFVPPAQLQQLAPITTRLETARTDFQYFVRANVALGASYWYETYRAQDFSLNGTTINQLNLPSAILSGYYYRPYRAHTGWVHMTYLW